MRYTTALIVTLFTLVAASGSAFAQGRGNGNGPKGPKKEKVEEKVHKGPKAPKPANAPAATTTTTTTTTTYITSTTPTSTYVRYPELEQRLIVLLPGVNLADAARGFQNWGEFVSVAHASHNLNIPFATLKARMTGPSRMSLGQAIQASRAAGTTTTVTTTTVQTYVRRAEAERDEDFRFARERSRK